MAKGGKKAKASAFDKLKGKHRLFVSEYFKDFNATRAYIRAGYKALNADAHASRLVGSGGVAKAISEQFDILGLTPERIESHLARMAFGDEPSKIVSEGGIQRREQDRLGATKELVRVRGLVTDKSEVNVTGNAFEVWRKNASDEELRRATSEKPAAGSD